MGDIRSVVRTVRRALEREERPPLGLTLLCAGIAAAMVLPLSWLVIEAATVDPSRARDLVVRWRTLEVLANSVGLMVGVTVASMVIGIPLAYLTTRTNLPFRRFWTIVAALPLVVPSYVGAFSFVSAFGPRGEFHDLLSPLGIERIPEIYGLGGAVIVISLYTYPYVYLTTRAALLSLDITLIEAARTLNHTRWETFKRVTVPHIRPAVAAGGLLSALYAISDFGTPAIMRVAVFTQQIYVEYNSFGQEYAALLSLQLLGVVLLVLALEQWIRTDRTVEGGTGRSGGEMRVDLGVWRWPATLLPGIVSVVALVVPVWILLLWLTSGGAGRRPSLAFEWSFALNSATVALAAAIAASAAALPIAYFSARHESVLATIFERATYVGFAVPGIVLALALVYFGAGYESLDIPRSPKIYQTIPLLVFAYVVRFAPQAVGTLRSGVLGVDPTLVEAARTLGETPGGAFRRVTIRLIAPSVTAGAALVFLTTMKELPVTLILRPTGFETIVTQIWRAQEAAYFQYAAVPALLLLAISGLSMVVLLVGSGREGL
ncbi:ABC transporter permease [Halopenitus sp. H-Gu1]|uniref:ABC transporter permease n=1 Tax=Halopenitus sp. H-Gu1 TaxID=3242697 RepID=UPI00359CF3B6